MNWVKKGISLLRETFKEWSEDKVPRLAAALSYYTAFSIAPLLVVVIAVAGLFFGDEAVRGQLDNQIQGLVGREGADIIQEVIANTSVPEANIVATIVGVATLLLGASGVFGQLQDALNTVWGVEPKPGRGLVGFITDRFFSFTMVLGVGFLLLVSLVISALLSGLNAFAVGLLPAWETLVTLLNQVISFAIVTLLFAMIYKILPDVKIAWRDVWVGAVITALLFTVGKYIIGLYLGNSSISSTYGAAGSFAVLLVWIFYSAQILLFGAEFTQVYAKHYGERILPDDHAVPVSDATLEAQGKSPKAATQDAPAQSALAPRERMPLYYSAEPGVQPRAGDGNLPLLWLAAAAIVSFAGGMWAAGRRSRHSPLPPDD